LFVDKHLDSRAFLGFDLKMFRVDRDHRSQYVLTRSMGEGRRREYHAKHREN
jgi:hypothetical protein